jgi:hypothetical protein
MLVADRLKKSVAEVMELSTLELSMWSAYFKLEQDQTERTMKQQRARAKGGRR